jgi:GR25 family glycosyltransferase involved in LPS biosynthesis
MTRLDLNFIDRHDRRAVKDDKRDFKEIKIEKRLYSDFCEVPPIETNLYEINNRNVFTKIPVVNDHEAFIYVIWKDEFPVRGYYSYEKAKNYFYDMIEGM